MPRGVSIHIGLNNVDPSRYNNWDGKLQNCVNDASAMQELAAARGFESTILLNERATALGILQAVSATSARLVSGDILLITYSGHGGQVPDTTEEEEDGQDETWVAYDRMVLDDELYQLWTQFAAGVRIVMISDSCHSGTIIRLGPARGIVDTSTWQREAIEQIVMLQRLLLGARENGRPTVAPLFRQIPPDIAETVYQQNGPLYRTIKALARGDRRDLVRASVLLISGCQDNQVSYELKDAKHGVFTEQLLAVWNNGAFRGSYVDFLREIAARILPIQSPNLMMVPNEDPALRDQQPFTINAASTTSTGTSTSRPSIIAPQKVASSDPAPVLTVHPGDRSHYVVEVATRAELFDFNAHGAERNDSNFFGSWTQLPFSSSSLYPASYRLPDSVWSRLRGATQLYYRLWASNSPNNWVDHISTTPDDAASSAPSILVVAGTSATDPQPQPGNTTGGQQTIRYPSGAEFAQILPAEVDDGINYADPSPANGVVPLIRVGERLDDRLSENFRVRELVQSSASGEVHFFRYARIDPTLIEALQRLRTRVGRPITVSSGYRYPDVNAAVGGAEDSRYLAGQAADIGCPGLSATDLARHTLEELGATIGIGLGANYIHVDVRGNLATWTYPGAAMSAAEFRTWANQIVAHTRHVRAEDGNHATLISETVC